MASLTLGVWILPEEEERWRRFYQELAGSRHAEYEQSRHRLGITREQVWIVSTHPGAMLITCLEAEPLEHVLGALLGSDHPFDAWFIQHCQRLLGLEGRPLPARPPPPSALLFAWSTI